jgi:hypothetical protein
MFLYHGYRNQGAGRGTRLREGCTTAGAKAIEAQVSITGVIFSFIGNTPKRYQCLATAAICIASNRRMHEAAAIQSSMFS